MGVTEQNLGKRITRVLERFEEVQAVKAEIFQVILARTEKNNPRILKTRDPELKKAFQDMRNFIAEHGDPYFVDEPISQ